MSVEKVHLPSTELVGKVCILDGPLLKLKKDIEDARIFTNRSPLIHLIELHLSLTLECEYRGSVEDGVPRSGLPCHGVVPADVGGHVPFPALALLRPEDVGAGPPDSCVDVLSLPWILDQSVPAIQVVGHHLKEILLDPIHFSLQ